MSTTIRTLVLLAAAITAAACAADTTTSPRPSSASPSAAKADARPERTTGHASLAPVRAATARYHDVAAALADGFTSTVECVAIPGGPGMGVHYVNGPRIADGVLDPTQPEVLVYEPRPDGTQRLVAVEYMIPRAMWDAAHPGTRPTLFGETFEEGPMASYTLHVWLWRHNTSGMFAAFNPAVSCPAGPGAPGHAGH